MKDLQFLKNVLALASAASAVLTVELPNPCRAQTVFPDKPVPPIQWAIPQDSEKGFNFKYSKEEIVIIPKESATDAQLDVLHRKLKTRSKKKFPEFRRIQVVHLPPGKDVQGAMLEFFNSGLVQKVEPNVYYQIQTLPNDPYVFYSSPRRTPQEYFLGADTSDEFGWYVNNTGEAARFFSGGAEVFNTGAGNVGADIDAAVGWSVRTAAPNQIVGVIDTGVRITHEDLAGNIWINPGEISGNGIDDDSNGYIDDVHGISAVGTTDAEKVDVTPTPTNPLAGHGSLAAGVIGAIGNNGLGMAGVAWNLKIMPLKATATGEVSAADILTCVQYAVQKGATIINMSLSGSGFEDTALRTAIDLARQHGLIVVTSPGNDGIDTDAAPVYPATSAFENIVNVGSNNRIDNVSSFSNFGATTVDLFAPGEYIVGPDSVSDSSYVVRAGTSFSAPVVSGVIALLKEQFPTDNYIQTINRLLSSTERIAAYTGKCQTGGRVNLYRALTTTSSRPANDDFVQAFAMASSPNWDFLGFPNPVVAIANNVGATSEPGEPLHAGLPGGKSVWWNWTPSSSFLGGSSRNVVVTAKHSDISITLAVYTGSSVTSLTPIVSGADGGAILTAQAGQTYRIAVDGNQGQTGLIRLALVKDPLFSDFDADQRTDLILQQDSGEAGVWFMDGAIMRSASLFSPENAGAGWRIFGCGDFSGDGKTDLALQHTDGSLLYWYMTGTARWSLGIPPSPSDPRWKAVSTGDSDRDAKLDIYWQHEDGRLQVWLMNGAVMNQSLPLNPSTTGDAQWRLVGAGDFNRDGKVDLAFQYADGTIAAWYMDGVNMLQPLYFNPSNPGDSQWRVKAVADLNNDGKPDLVWQHSGDTSVAVWFMDGVNLVGAQFLSPRYPGGTWKIAAP